jgi:hypothetical protein
MGFWENYTSERIEVTQEGLSVQPLPSVLIKTSKDIKSLSQEDYAQLILFWKEHFGSPPRTPTLLVNPVWLQADASTGNFAFRLRGWKGVIYGRKIGRISLNRENQHVETYLIEGLCLKAEERQKALTPLLLDACLLHLQKFLPNTRVLFLKEGKKAPTEALVSDTYLYRRLRAANKNRRKPIKAEEAKILFKKLTEDSQQSWLSNEFGLPNSRTNFYATPCRNALMAVTETHQIHHLDGQRLGLITGFICDAALEQRDQVILQEELLNSQPYVWIWSPSSYVSDPTQWLEDGLISYQPFLFTVKPQVKMANVFLAL